jgi:uncharacterized protein YndB with AHSA1/START domain
MTPETTTGYELKLDRTLNAPVERVWKALTEGAQIARWYGPSDDFRIEVMEWDCRVGGDYRVAMHHKEGQTHTCFGTFKTLLPNERIAYSWAWEGQPPMDTLVTFELAAEGDRTHLSFTHAGFPAEEAREQHRMGWTGSLERLQGAVA